MSFKIVFLLFWGSYMHFATYRHLAFDPFLPGIVNHSRIRGAVHYVKIDTRSNARW